MKTFMLDTQIYDLVADTPGLIDFINRLATAGKIKILCTNIQNDELTKIRDEGKRVEVSRITRQQVVTASAVVGISIVGGATCGDGSSSGISLDQIRSAYGGHTKDALIATTAARDAEVLVTEDRRLANRVRATTTSCSVWSFEQLKNYLFCL